MYNKPLLTIGIPTYNRAYFLNQTLSLIVKEVINDPRVEIVICDNGSTDTTREVVSNYMSQTNNIVYFRHAENLGFDRNLKTIYDMSKGLFIKTHGDDDLILPSKINQIMNIIEKYNHIDLFFVSYHSAPFTEGIGIDNYIRDLHHSNGLTYITSIIFRRSAYNNIVNKDKYLASHIYQLYIQMELLKANPNYGLIGGGIVKPHSGGGGRRFYNLGEVFIKNYFTILREYLGHELSQAAYNSEKSFVHNNIVIPILNQVKRNALNLDVSNLEKYLSEW
ncbi:MAG: glycosyltransferase family 2 protein [Clostridium sp.]